MECRCREAKLLLQGALDIEAGIQAGDTETLLTMSLDSVRGLLEEAKTALGSCDCEKLRGQLESFRLTTEHLLNRAIPPAQGPLEFALCLMRAVKTQQAE